MCRVLELNIEKHGAAHYLGYLGADEINRQRVAGMRGPASYIISESGLYKLVMRSDKPEAREFQDWVTREVLPAILKDGMYVAGEEKVKTGAGLPTYLTTPREPKSCAAATEATIDYPPRRVEEVQKPRQLPLQYGERARTIRPRHLGDGFFISRSCCLSLGRSSWLQFAGA